MKSRKRLLSLILALAMLFSVVPTQTQVVSAETNGVQEKLDELRSVYYTGTYFTGSGNPATDWHDAEDTSADSHIYNIPARGGLPAGRAVGVSGTSCWAFAQYCFFYIFGHNFATNVVYPNSPQLGDAVNFNYNAHYGIYLYEDSQYYYIYDANYDPDDGDVYTHDCRVSYGTKLSKSSWSITTVYRSANYDAVYSTTQPDVTYATITAGNYYLKNNSTGKYLAVDGGVDADQQNISVADFTGGNEMKLAISAAIRGYKMRPHCATRIVNPYGTTVSSGLDVSLWPDVSEATQWWGFEKVTGGYIIRNMQNQNCVLSVSGTNVVTASYTGGAEQIWTLASADTTPDVPVWSHSHSVCMDGSCTEHAALEYVAWSDTDTLPVAGNYYLTADVVMASSVTVTSQLNLCLNGHTVTAPSGQRHLTINSGGAVSITDCGTTGRFTGGSQDYGGSIYIGSGGTLDLYGGIISGNSGNNGGIYVADGGTFNQHSGEVTDAVTYPPVTGTCGDNMTWMLDKTTGTLTISGSGTIDDPSWQEYKDSIKHVLIKPGVTSICAGAFQNCAVLETAFIPAGLQMIGESAFANCSSLKSVAVPEGVTEIQANTFNGCTALTTVTISSSVNSVGESAFGGCNALTKLYYEGSALTWSKVVVADGNDALSGAELSYTYVEGVCGTGGNNGDNVKWKLNLVTGQMTISGNYIMKSYTEASPAPWYAYRTSIKTLVIEPGVVTVGMLTFYNCTNLTSVSMPSSINAIGDSTFKNCDSLTTITIPEGVTSIARYAFSSCDNLVSISLPDSLTEIGVSAFESCKRLTSIVIPGSVTSIGSSAFARCSSLTSATIQMGVKTIGGYAFEGCTSLTSINIPDSVTKFGGWAVFDTCTSLTSVTLGSGLTTITRSAFDECINLKKIIIRSSVTTIEAYAFYNCYAAQVVFCGTPSQWSRIYFGHSNAGISGKTPTYHALPTQTGSKPRYCTICGMHECDVNGHSWMAATCTTPKTCSVCGTTQGDLVHSFTNYISNHDATCVADGTKTAKCDYCSATDTQIDAGSTIDHSYVNSICQVCGAQDPMSGNCGDDLTWTLDDAGTLTVSGTGPMTNYESGQTPWNDYICDVRTVVIESGVTSIGDNAFYNTDTPGLTTSVTIPDTVTSIGNHAFDFCEYLTNITIPDSVISIGEGAFDGCGLTDVYYDGTQAQWDAMSIGSSNYPLTAATLHIAEADVTLKGITIKTQPTKAEYWVGENLDTTGLTLTATYSDGSTKEIAEGFTVTGFDSATAGEKTVTVTYEDFTATFTVTVKDPTITGITIKTRPGKTEYWVGETLNTTGLTLTATYSDGSTQEIAEGFTVTGFDSATAGEKTVTVTYEGFTATFTVIVKEPTITGITVKTQPAKTEYWVGESLDTTGLTLTATYSDGSTQEITEGFTVTGFDSATAGEKTVTVTYEDFTATFTVTVKEPTITGITVKTQPAKTEYWVGESLDTIGLTLTATYSDGSTQEITEGFTVSGFDSTTAGTKTVTVTYEGFNATFTVTVKDPTITGITIKTQPTKAEYWVGESLDTTGLTLTATYSDGSTQEITEGFSVTGFDSATAGEKTVTVTYEGFTATFTVTVNETVIDENAPKIVLESKKVVKGSEFTVTVKIENNPGFTYLEVTPTYDGVLTLVKVENGELISDFTKGKQYVWVADEDVTDDGLLMTFTFSVADTVEPGIYQAGFQLRTCGNYNEEAITLNIVAADIEVIDYVYGDATGDGVVDGFDVIRLKKYLANYDYETGTSTVEIAAGADANGDGTIDGFDVIRLKKYLANYDYETGSSTVVLGPQ